MHEQGVVHRDIKAENILYNPITSKIKLFDFGFAAYKQVVNFDNIRCITSFLKFVLFYYFSNIAFDRSTEKKSFANRHSQIIPKPV